MSAHQGYVERRAAFGARLELPHSGLVLIINLRSGLSIASAQAGVADDRGSQRRDFVAGIHDHAVAVASDGLLECLEVKLSPTAAHALLGVPLNELRNTSVCLEQALGSRFHHMRERLGELSNWQDRFDLVDRFLLEKLTTPVQGAREVAWACGRLVSSAGSLAISELARELGYSRKHVATLFKTHVGVSPKVYARIIRFEHARARLDELASLSSATRQDGLHVRESPRGLGELALDFGYYDQAHFNREFRDLAGVNPRDYLRRAMPDGGTLAGG